MTFGVSITAGASNRMVVDVLAVLQDLDLLQGDESARHHRVENRILYAVQSLAPHYGEGAGAIAIELYALHNVLYAVGAYPAGMLADRYGKRGFLLAAYGLAAMMNLVLIVSTPSAVALAFVFILASSGYALQQSLERAIAADVTPVEVRSTGFGVLAAANGVGDLVSSAIVGTLWTAISPQAAFAYALVMTLAGAVVTGAALRGGNAARSS